MSPCYSLSPDTQSQHRETWAAELAELDKEILDLEEEIRRKVRVAGQLKQKLGVTAWREFSEDLREGMKKFKESPTYQTVQAELSSLAIKMRPEYSSLKLKGRTMGDCNKYSMTLPLQRVPLRQCREDLAR